MTTSGTRGTAIAALEAERNAQQVIAEAALQGERRAAIARIAMIVMFALVSNLDADERSDLVQTAVGAAYTLWAVIVAVATHRAQTAVPQYAKWRPVLLVVMDFALVTTMAMLDVRRGIAYSPGQHVVASMIVMSFAVARYGVVHVVLAVALAITSYLVASGYGGVIATHATVFVIAGYIVFGFVIGLTNRALHRMFAGLRQRDNLTRFMPRQVAERVIAAGPNSLAPALREVTVLFSDIRGFTAMSEGKDPRDVLGMLDDYFGRMSQVVKGHDGVVGKFLGDGMLAFWGVPDPIEDHAVRAVRAARDMRRVLRELNQHRDQHGEPPIRIGIGIHTGTVAAGMLGGQLQAEYTIIGDAVNVASRIEGLTKQHDTDVLVSETTWNLLADQRGQRIAAAEIRGRKEPVTLFALDSSAATVEVSPVPDARGAF